MASETSQKSIVQDTVSEARKAARSLKCKEYEIFCNAVRGRSVLVERDRVVGASSSKDFGIFVRAVTDGRMGMAFTNTFDSKHVRMCVASALKMSRAGDKDRNWQGFPSSKRSYRPVGGVFDKRVSSMDLSELRSSADVMIGSARGAGSVSVTGGDVEAIHKVIAISNSSGIDALMEETIISADCISVSGTGNAVTPECMDAAASRSKNLDFELLGESSGRIARLCARAANARTERCKVLFSPLSLGSSESGLLNIVLSRALSGEYFVRKNSFLADKVGKDVAGSALSLTDDPTIPGRAGSRPFDDEGLPCKKTVLVKDGVLKGFLWNSYFGAIAGEDSTGNGTRDYSTGNLSIAPMNLVVERGRGDLDSLVRQMDRGYLVWGCQGAHTANVETGDFSFVASPGLKIEHGEIVGGVSGALVSGNVMGLLGGVEMVGSDQKDFGSSLMPSMVFRDVRITTG